MGATISATKLMDKPVPVWIVPVPDGKSSMSPPFNDVEFLLTVDPFLSRCQYRAVSWERLQNILETGIDVIPTDSPIYVSNYFDKAWEYGEWPKVMMALDPTKLQ